MKAREINLSPVNQTGHNCKITAVATVDQYYGSLFRFNPLPLHKHKKINGNVSIRQLSKAKGSIQGELLEIAQVRGLFEDIGYETDLLDFNESVELFEKQVAMNLENNHLIVAFFAVDRLTGKPTNFNDLNEHAAIISGFDYRGDTKKISIIHWEEEWTVNTADFFNSSQTLPEERQPEFYTRLLLDRKKKYDLAEIHSKQLFKSIVPEKNSGFRGKFIVVKQPRLEKILQAEKRYPVAEKSESGRIHFLNTMLGNGNAQRTRF